MLKRLLPELTISRGLVIFIVVTLTGTSILSVFHFYWGTQKIAKIEAMYLNSLASKPPDTEQQPTPIKSLSSSSVLDSIERFIPPDLSDDPMFQKLIAVMGEDSFQEAVKTRKPQNIKEFADLLEAHGVTELSEIDVNQLLDDAYDSVTQQYHANNPGTTPEDEDEAMAKRFREVLMEHGLRDGVMKITMDQQNMIWIGARFKGNEVAFNEWWMDVIATYEWADSASTLEAPVSPSDETSLDIPLAETEQGTSDHTQSEMRGDPPIADTVDQGGPRPVVEPEKVVTEVSPQLPALPAEAEFEASLKERFSKDRFDRAMDTLDRYGEEEGLRHLKEADPEVAEQIEQHRNRSRSEDSDKSEEEVSQ